jgi:hypothetical protein
MSIRLIFRTIWFPSISFSPKFDSMVNMNRRLLFQIVGIVAWFGLIKGCLAIQTMSWGTLQLCRDGR